MRVTNVGQRQWMAYERESIILASAGGTCFANMVHSFSTCSSRCLSIFSFSAYCRPFRQFPLNHACAAARFSVKFASVYSLRFIWYHTCT